MCEVGKRYRTRDGKEVRVYAVAETDFGHQSIHGAIKWPDGAWFSQTWYPDGYVLPSADKLETHPYDILEEWKDPPRTWWAVLNSGGKCMSVYSTKEEARIKWPEHQIVRAQEVEDAE